jgi:hypothetical protein
MGIKEVKRKNQSSVLVRTGKGSGGGIVTNRGSDQAREGISAPVAPPVRNGQKPNALRTGLQVMTGANQHAAQHGRPGVPVSYDPTVEASRLDFAMGEGGSWADRRARKKARRGLEELFGKIDWDDRSEARDTTAERNAALREENARTAPAKTSTQEGPQATDPALLRAHSGSTGTLWLRSNGDDGGFVRAASNVRMLHMPAGSHGTDRNSEWYTKEHVLIQYGTHANRYHLDNVSFSPTDR